MSITKGTCLMRIKFTNVSYPLTTGQQLICQLASIQSLGIDSLYYGIYFRFDNAISTVFGLFDPTGQDPSATTDLAAFINQSVLANYTMTLVFNVGSPGFWGQTSFGNLDISIQVTTLLQQTTANPGILFNVIGLKATSTTASVTFDMDMQCFPSTDLNIGIDSILQEQILSNLDDVVRKGRFIYAEQTGTLNDISIEDALQEVIRQGEQREPLEPGAFGSIMNSKEYSNDQTNAEKNRSQSDLIFPSQPLYKTNLDAPHDRMVSNKTHTNVTKKNVPDNVQDVKMEEVKIEKLSNDSTKDRKKQYAKERYIDSNDDSQIVVPFTPTTNDINKSPNIFYDPKQFDYIDYNNDDSQIVVPFTPDTNKINKSPNIFYGKTEQVSLKRDSTANFLSKLRGVNIINQKEYAQLRAQKKLNPLFWTTSNQYSNTFDQDQFKDFELTPYVSGANQQQMQLLYDFYQGLLTRQDGQEIVKEVYEQLINEGPFQTYGTFFQQEKPQLIQKAANWIGNQLSNTMIAIGSSIIGSNIMDQYDNQVKYQNSNIGVGLLNLVSGVLLKMQQVQVNQGYNEQSIEFIANMLILDFIRAIVFPRSDQDGKIKQILEHALEKRKIYDVRDLKLSHETRTARAIEDVKDNFKQLQRIAHREAHILDRANHSTKFGLYTPNYNNIDGDFSIFSSKLKKTPYVPDNKTSHLQGFQKSTFPQMFTLNQSNGIKYPVQQFQSEAIRQLPHQTFVTLIPQEEEERKKKKLMNPLQQAPFIPFYPIQPVDPNPEPYPNLFPRLRAPTKPARPTITQTKTKTKKKKKKNTKTKKRKICRYRREKIDGKWKMIRVCKIVKK